MCSSDLVHFIPFQKDPSAVFTGLTALLHTSTLPEPFGRVIVEAMAAGTPVIAANDGGVPEIITDGVDGFLAPPGDVTAYLAALRKLLARAPDARLSAAAREKVQRQFSIARVRDDFVRLVGEVCEEIGRAHV